MSRSSGRRIAASAGFLCLAVAAALGTAGGAQAQHTGGGCGEGGGNLCKTVKTCLGTECITVSNYYKPEIQ